MERAFLRRGWPGRIAGRAGVIAGFLLGSLFNPGAAFAQDAAAWPQRSVKIVVPYAPGASSDNVARRIALALTERLGQSFVVENRIGAGGSIGTNYVMRERPDGYTLLAHDPGFLLLPQLATTPPYDPNELVPIAAFMFAPLGIVVQTSSRFQTLADLIGAAKAEPKKISYGSGGEGTTPHLGSEQFARAAGVQLYHVTYKGAADAVIALLGGQIDMQFVTPTTVLQHVKSGRLRMLAISGDERVKVLPDTPTFKEAGLDGVQVTNWIGLWAPKGTPPGVIEKLQGEIRQAMASKELIGFAESIGVLPNTIVGSDFVKFIAEDTARLKRLADQIGLQKR
ncbi:MAG: tripartite tricarboxylate transporter substrate binding protein [Lautropia sp.]